MERRIKDAKVALYDITGSQIGDIELRDDIFGVKVNTHVMYEAVKIIWLIKDKELSLLRPEEK